MIEIITNEIEFQNLEAQWNELYEKSVCRTPFQSFHFNWTSWTNFQNKQKKNKLWIITHNGNYKKVRGILPLYIDKNGILRFINDLHVDFCDGLFDNNENIYFTLRKIVELIINEKKIKGVAFLNLTDKSIIFPYFKSFLKQSFVFSTTEHSYLPSFKETNIELSSHLRSKERYALENANKVNKDKSYKIYRCETDAFPYDKLIEIRNNMRMNGTRVPTFYGDDFINLSRNLYENSLMVISITQMDDFITSASTIIADHEKKWYMFWISMYNSDVKLINIFNYNQFINSQISDKESIIDFGRGGYDYKFRNYLPIVHNVYELVWAKTFWTTLMMFYKINIFYLKRIVKPIIRK
jgi:hypothetical protein